MRESIYLGQPGTLRAQFTDDENTPFQASGVLVNLYAPGLDPDIDSPTVSGLVPIYIGNGVFEVTVTPTGQGGRWIDEWTGEILGSTTTARFAFTVLSAGAVHEYPTFGLKPNNLVEIILDTSIASLEGATLASNFNTFFTTQYSPLYSDVRKVKLAAGGFLDGVAEDTINLAILEASLEADVLSFKTERNQKLYLHARREFVTCKAAQMLAANVLANGGVLKSKLLADFRVDYDTRAMMDLMSRMEENCAKWEAQLQTGGQARTVQGPQNVVKGELDPNRPTFGRLWIDPAPGEKPIGNSKTRIVRRYYKTNRPRGGW